MSKVKTKKFREYNQAQQFLIPPDIRDWVPEDDFSRFINDLVNILDLSKFEEFHKPGTGQPPYDPQMMVKVILYCFCTGVYSSRKMEVATYRDIGVRFLAANQHPDYSSFQKFGKRHTKAIKDLFVQVVMLCKRLGMVTLGHVCIDGTRMKANASRSKNVLASEIDELIAQGEALYAELSKRWEDMDEQERNAEPEVPKELAKSRTRIDALKDARTKNNELEAERLRKFQEREAAERASRQTSETEADGDLSVIELATLKEARQEAGLSQTQLGKATGIRQSRISQLENGQRPPSEEEASQICQVLNVPGIQFRDRAVRVKECKDVEPPKRNYISITDPYSYILSRKGKESMQGYNAQAAADSETQIIVGAYVSVEPVDRRLLVPMLEKLKDNGLLDSIKVMSADSGYFSSQALASPLASHIDLYIPPDRLRGSKTSRCKFVRSMRDKMSSESGRTARKVRSSTIEPVFGHLKWGMNFYRFLSRNLEGVSREWDLGATAHNILKMFKRGR